MQNTKPPVSVCSVYGNEDLHSHREQHLGRALTYEIINYDFTLTISASKNSWHIPHGSPYNKVNLFFSRLSQQFVVAIDMSQLQLHVSYSRYPYPFRVKHTYI